MKALRAIAVIGAIILCLAVFFESRPDEAVIYESEIDLLDINDKFSDAISQMQRQAPLANYNRKGIEALRRDIAAIPAETEQLEEITGRFLQSVDTLLLAWDQYDAGQGDVAEETIREARRLLSSADRALNSYKRELEG